MLKFDSFTNDPDLAKKILIGSLLALTGVGMIPVMGWALENLRRNIYKDAPVLPGWDNIGSFTLEGLKGMLLILIWSLPVAVPIIGASLAGIFLPGYFASEDDAVLAIILLNFCVIGLTFIYIIPLGFLSIPALGLLATDTFKKALNPLNAWRIFKANFGGFFLAWGLGTVTSMVLGMFGTLLCLIGTLPAFVVTYGLMGQYFGFAYRDALEKLAVE